MSQVYAAPSASSSKPTDDIYKPLKQQRAQPALPSLTPALLYAEGTRAFLSRDFVKTASCLHLARPKTTRQSDEWFRLLQSREPNELELNAVGLEQRIAVLEITLLATAHATAQPASLPWPAHFAALFALTPKQLLEAVWVNLFAEPASPPPAILASPAAGFVHPSLAATLVLAALKLGEPDSARALAEAWFGSVAGEVDDVIADAAGRADLGAEFPVAGQGTIGSSQVLPKPGAKPDPAKQLLGAWVKLHDLLCLHVLPRLGEWEAAADAVNAQAVENGGFVPHGRVDVSLWLCSRTVELLARKLIAPFSMFS